MVLKASDLRIGNLVYAATGENNEPVPCLVFQIHQYWIEWGEAGGNRTSILRVEGIPLSCEVLEKTDMELFLSHYTPHISFKGMNLFQTKKGFRMARSNRIIQYLHELQSVVYFLTGEELTVNL